MRIFSARLLWLFSWAAALMMGSAIFPSEPERSVGSNPSRTQNPSSSESPSHYLRFVRPVEERAGHPWNVKRMLPRLLSPFPREKHAPPMPQCRALPGDGTYARRIQPYFDALSSPFAELHSAAHSSGSGVRTILQSIKKECDALRARLTHPPGANPVRILTKHYPRPDLPGRCVTLHVTLFSVPDPWFDDGGLTPELLERRRGQRIDGRFVELRMTLRLDTEQPRLIEAEVSASPEIVGAFHRESIAAQLRSPELDAVDGDDFYGAHFQIYGGGKPRMWSRAYSTERATEEQRYDIKLLDIDAATAQALLALVRKL